MCLGDNKNLHCETEIDIYWMRLSTYLSPIPHTLHYYLRHYGCLSSTSRSLKTIPIFSSIRILLRTYILIGNEEVQIFSTLYIFYKYFQFYFLSKQSESRQNKISCKILSDLNYLYAYKWSIWIDSCSYSSSLTIVKWLSRSEWSIYIYCILLSLFCLRIPWCIEGIMHDRKAISISFRHGREGTRSS